MKIKQSERDRFCRLSWNVFYSGNSVAQTAISLGVAIYEVENAIRDYIDARDALAKRKLRAAKVKK